MSLFYIILIHYPLDLQLARHTMPPGFLKPAAALCEATVYFHLTLASILQPRQTCTVRRGSWTCQRVEWAGPRPDADACACALGTRQLSLHLGGHSWHACPSSVPNDQLLFVFINSWLGRRALYTETLLTPNIRSILQDDFGLNRHPASWC